MWYSCQICGSLGEMWYSCQICGGVGDMWYDCQNCGGLGERGMVVRIVVVQVNCGIVFKIVVVLGEMWYGCKNLMVRVNLFQLVKFVLLFIMDRLFSWFVYCLFA